FFFSSRRRHTRSDRDWSSDVCSSDLPNGSAAPVGDAAGEVIAESERRVSFGEPGQPTVTGEPAAVKLRRERQTAMGSKWQGGCRSEERRVGKEGRCRWARGQERENGE